MEAGQQNKIVAIIQARMQSSRLPGKILMPMPILGRYTILECIIKQLKKTRHNIDIIIATSKNPENDALEDILKENDVDIYRGSEDDVLSRFLGILKSHNYKTVIRITADNPILDYNILENVLENHLDSDADYSMTSGLPLGMNFELFKSESLLRLKETDLTDDDKEHVTLKFRKDQNFTQNEIKIDFLNNNNSIRLTIDYPEDYLVVSTIYEIAEKNKIEIGLDLIKFVKDKYPWLLEINRDKLQKKAYNNFEEEQKDAIPFLNSMGFKLTVLHLRELA